MIYLLHGTDTEKSRNKLHELVAVIMKKKPNAGHLKMSDEDFSVGKLDELMGVSGLFASKAIVEMDNVLKNKEAKEIILEKIKEIKESENIFIFLEGKLDKKSLEKFEKNSEKVQVFEDKKEYGEGESGRKFGMGEERKSFDVRDFNIFTISDLFGRRDKKALWVFYEKCCRRNIPAEEVHGLLAWQARAMLLASKSKNMSESGLKTYVYQKSSGYLRNFKQEELVNLSSKLVTIYHEARRGKMDLESALEKFILEV